MVDIARPVYGEAWASVGEKVSPTLTKIQGGWIQEMMPYQWENFLQNRQDTALLYMLQKGVPEWDASQEYIAGKSVVTYQTNLYISVLDSTNVLPTVQTSWKKLNPSTSSSGLVTVAGGGTGASTAADARTNLGLGSIATATAPSSNGVVVRSAADTLTSRSVTGTTNNIVVTNGNGVAGNITINTGSNVALLNTDSSWTSTGSIRLPSGSTSQQGTSTPGRVRFNLEADEFHGAYSDGWKVLAKPASAVQTPIADVGNFYTSSNVEGALQEVGLKASFVKDAILAFPTYAAASAAAATLPDGQVVVAGDLSYKVQAGTLVFSGVWRGVRRTVSEFGAVGNGIADDSDALIAAITSGHPLDWENKNYRITRELTAVTNHVIDWISSGAVIRMDTATHQYACLHLSVGEFKHSVVGVLEIDAQKKANVGLRAYPTTPSASPDFLAEDLFVRNVHRTSAFADGDAIFLDRGWGTVTLVRPKIRDLTMAVGAGVAGVYGIFGITVSRGGSGGVYAAKCVNIVHADIDGIWSEDPAYLSDQDAIRVFTRYGGSATGGKQNEMTFTVLGGVVKDVRGRSVKGQTEKGGVDGLSVIRTTRASAGVAQRLNANADIELQTGGGFIRNIEFSYSGFVPHVVARIIQADFTVAYSTPPIISNINGTVTGSISPVTAVRFSLGDSSTSGPGSDKFFNVMASNVNIVAEVPLGNAIDFTRSGAQTNSFNLIASNINAPVSEYFINTPSNTGAPNGKVLVTNALNTAPLAVNLLRTVAGFDCIAENIIGINDNSAQPNRIVRGKKAVIGEYAPGLSSEAPLVVGRGTSLAAVADLSSRTAIFQRNGAATISVIADQFGAAGLTLGSPSVYNNFGLYVNQPDGVMPFGYVSIAGNPRVRFSDTALEPYVNNGISFGTATRKISEVFATNGTINTSDARLKTAPEDVPLALLDAISEVTPRWWQWLASVETKGADARWFAGPMAQDIRDALVRRGLMQEGSTNSPWAGLCYDEWDDEFVPVLAERINAEGEIEEYDTGETRLITAAGNAWSVRHDQVLYVMLYAMQRKLDSLTERLNALEERD